MMICNVAAIPAKAKQNTNLEVLCHAVGLSDDALSLMPLYRDWLALAILEKLSDSDGAKHPEGRSGHRGQTTFRNIHAVTVQKRRKDSRRLHR